MITLRCWTQNHSFFYYYYYYNILCTIHELYWLRWRLVSHVIQCNFFFPPLPHFMANALLDHGSALLAATPNAFEHPTEATYTQNIRTTQLWATPERQHCRESQHYHDEGATSYGRRIARKTAAHTTNGEWKLMKVGSSDRELAESNTCWAL